MNIGERLKDARKKAKLSQIDVSGRTGIGNKTISDYETGKTSPDPERLRILCELYGVSADYIVGNFTVSSALHANDENDIAKALDIELKRLEFKQDGLMFDGEPMDDETLELLKKSLENTMALARQWAKKKYTPLKYRSK